MDGECSESIFTAEMLCRVCIGDGGLASSRCERCADFSLFLPDTQSAPKLKTIGMADVHGLSRNGKLALTLFLAQRPR